MYISKAPVVKWFYTYKDGEESHSRRANVFSMPNLEPRVRRDLPSPLPDRKFCSFAHRQCTPCQPLLSALASAVRSCNCSPRAQQRLARWVALRRCPSERCVSDCLLIGLTVKGCN